MHMGGVVTHQLKQKCAPHLQVVRVTLLSGNVTSDLYGICIWVRYLSASKSLLFTH